MGGLILPCSKNSESTSEAAVREDLTSIVSSSPVTQREALESLRQSRPKLLQDFFRTLSCVKTIVQLSESGLKIVSKGFAASLAEFRCQGSPNSAQSGTTSISPKHLNTGCCEHLDSNQVQ